MMLAIWDDGETQRWVTLAVIAITAYVLVLWVAALVWTYRDINSRSRDPMMQGVALLIVFVFNLPGLMLYLILRPKDTLAEMYDRQLEAEALLHELQEQATCPACRRKVHDDYVACPYCRTTLRTPCTACDKPMASTWVLCPYCGTNRVPAIVPARERPMEPAAPTRLERPADAATATQANGQPTGRPRRPSTATYTPPAPAAPPAAPDPAIDAGT